MKDILKYDVENSAKSDTEISDGNLIFYESDRTHLWGIV